MTSSDLLSMVLTDLRDGGTLARSLPGYEQRSAQIEMASLVTEAVEHQTHAIQEASTGTGKSLAYLLPIVHSGKVALVSTANKALQEQLFYKDIPFIQKHIKDFDAALVKGMGNLICIKRFEEEQQGMQVHTQDPVFRQLERALDDPEWKGDFETLSFQVQSETRGKICADSDQCAWSKCPYFSTCYVRQMRLQAQESQVIVINHTLLLLNAQAEGKILPEHDLIVIDEAHELDEEATRVFTTTVKDTQIYTLLALKLLRSSTPANLQNEVNQLTTRVWQQLDLQFEEKVANKLVLHAPVEEGLQLASRIGELVLALRERRFLMRTEEEEILFNKLIERTTNLAEKVRLVFAVDNQTEFVYYLERTLQRRGGYDIEASSAPLDVSKLLKHQLFEQKPVICTSATLATIDATGGMKGQKPTFAYFRRRVGLDAISRRVLERILPLTFVFQQQALLYVPRDLPEPAYGKTQAAEDYTLEIARRMYSLVKASRGRAFLLFSSKVMLDKVYELISPHLPYLLLKQGDMTRIELTRRFREEEGAVLFGLKSFWEGVDIAGDALSLVVIDRVPFDPPDDPVHEARVNLMKAAGENWFGTYVLPRAILRLKQGVGRLIRTRGDRGVMAILDVRLYSKPYGKLIFSALPPARRTEHLADVKRFFEEERNENGI